MNQLLRNLLLASSLLLAAPNVFAWALAGGMGIQNNQVKAVVVAASAPEEDLTGLYVVAIIDGEDITDTLCKPNNEGEGLSCKAIAEVPSEIGGTRYCAHGSGSSLVWLSNTPNPNDTALWHGQCATYQPPWGLSLFSPSFLGCQDACARWQLSWTAANFAGTYRIQSRPEYGGTWSDYTTTANTSTILHLGQNAREWRVRGENSHGVGPWSAAIAHTTGKCGTSGGPGGGGPLD